MTTKPKQLNPKNRYVELEYVYVLAGSREKFDAFREDTLHSWAGCGDVWVKNSSGEFGFLNICFRFVARPEYLRGVRGYFHIAHGFWDRKDAEEYMNILRSRRVFGDLEECPKEYLPKAS